jgi:hypothetical protein
LILVIDLGFAIELGDDESPELRALDGRVTVLLPAPRACRAAASPTLPWPPKRPSGASNPPNTRNERQKPTCSAKVIPGPVVVTFTTELACMAVNELLNRLNGFRGPGIRNLVRKFHLVEDFKPGAKPRPGCALCDDERYWGRGDVEPFLDRS